MMIGVTMKSLKEKEAEFKKDILMHKMKIADLTKDDPNCGVSWFSKAIFNT